MKKVILGFATAAFLTPAVVAAQSTTSPGRSNEPTYNTRTYRTPTDCQPGDTRAACQQAQLPRRSPEDAGPVERRDPNTQNARPPATGDIGSYGGSGPREGKKSR